MDLKEQSYSMLIVSSSEKLNTALSQIITGLRYQPVRFVTSVNAAKRAWSESSYDHIIVNSPLPDDTGIRFAIDTAASAGTSVLILINNSIYEDVRDIVVRHGIFTLPKPVSLPLLTQSLEWMDSMRERLRQFEKKTLSVEEKIAEIRIINRAKWILISTLNMDEPHAHRYLEKQAMDRCISKKEAAEEIIRTYK